jgi:predicted ATPase
MSHPLGDLLSQHLHRKHGLSQARLAEGILQDPSIIGKMCKGERLTGSHARERVVAIIGWLHTQGVLKSLTEANALLAAAGMSNLRQDEPGERALVQQLHPQPLPGHPPAMAPARKTNLPAPLTSFVGGAQEVAEVAQTVAAHRLVTLTGAGGVGKTRLAVEAGIQLVWGEHTSAFADGVWLVELAALADGPLATALATQAIANRFKLAAQADHTTLELLQEHLASKHLLLILDNCEHLVDVCAEIVEGLLHRCWQLHILTTSREALRIPGETVYPVLPLALPDPDAGTPAQLLASPAAQLFVGRMGVAPSLHKAQKADMVAIATICRQLDGIPLALELAAPLTRHMTFTEIAAQLHDQMAILTNSYRTDIPRHQTMHGALIWGYRLLAPAEQKVLARSSVFAGGWTLAASQTVCGDELGESLLLSLHQLVAKSFVLVEHHNGTRRYRLLEPVRQFAHAQLVANGELDATQRRHAAYFLALAEQMEQARDTPQEREWLQTLEAERDNIRSVNAWALDQNEAEFAQRFNGSLFAFWLYCTSLAEASHWLEAALALRPALAPRPVENGAQPTATALSTAALALDAAGYAAVLQHDYARAQTRFERELALYSELGDQRGVATALRGCGFTAMLRDDLDHAQVCDEQALILSRAAQDHRGVAWVLFDLGYLAFVRGDLPAAQTLLEEALPQLLELGITFGAFRALLAQGHVLRALNQPEQARRCYRDALHLQRPLHYSQYVADGLEGLAGIAAHASRPEHAARLFGAAHAHRIATAMPRWRHQETGYSRDLALARCQLNAEIWGAAWSAGCAMTLEQAVAYALAA